MPSSIRQVPNQRACAGGYLSAGHPANVKVGPHLDDDGRHGPPRPLFLVGRSKLLKARCVLITARARY
jgi:hypothetical protein